jgi:hypothetical protein
MCMIIVVAEWIQMPKLVILHSVSRLVTMYASKLPY